MHLTNLRIILNSKLFILKELENNLKITGVEMYK